MRVFVCVFFKVRVCVFTCVFDCSISYLVFHPLVGFHCDSHVKRLSEHTENNAVVLTPLVTEHKEQVVATQIGTATCATHSKEEGSSFECSI